jgi:hypothetical protein
VADGGPAARDQEVPAMGSLDRFRGRKPRGRDEPGPIVNGGPAVPYVFAHQALRSVAFDDPAGFLFAMSESNPGREAILHNLWRQVCEHCPWDAEAARGTPSFAIEPFLLCGHCGILVGLPEPRRIAEVSFAALVAHLPESAGSPASGPPPAWYFTLERTSELLMGPLPTTGRNRLVNALRSDSGFLVTLLGETMFRGCFYRDLSPMTADLARDARLRPILPALLPDPSEVVGDAAGFAAFLDEYERRMPPTSTLLCGWAADGSHENYGTGPQADPWSFLAELAVWFSVRGAAESAGIAADGWATPARTGGWSRPQ